MPLKDLYNEKVNVARLTAILDNQGHATAKKEYTAHIANLGCHVQAYDEDITQDNSNSFGKDWKMFCPLADIIEGDRITRGSDEYRIVAIKTFNNYGDNSHMELRIRIFKS